MKTIFATLLFGGFLIFFGLNTNAQSNDPGWKHYEYHEINLQFDLPADFTFEFPDKDSLSFVGHNNLITFSFRQLPFGIYSDEQRKAELYRQGGFTGDYSEDVNFMSGTTTNGYYMAGTHAFLNAGNEDCVTMLMSDPKNAQLNYIISITYGGEDNSNSAAYAQASKIVEKFGPIVR